MKRQFLLVLAICCSAFALPQNKKLEHASEDTIVCTATSPEHETLLKSNYQDLEPRNTSIITVKDPADLDNRVTHAGDKLVVLFIMGEWCGWSRRITPTVEDIAENNVEKVVVLKVKVRRDQLFLMDEDWKYGIESVTGLPHFKILKNGTQIEEFTGGSSAKSKKLRDIVARTTQNTETTEKEDNHI